MRALIIEDEASLRSHLATCLSEASFEICGAHDGLSGLDIALAGGIDVAVVDLGLPHVSGIEVIRRARRAGQTYPILILTAREGWQAKVEGLEAGADDYLVKPFEKEELLARLRALLRRSSPKNDSRIYTGPYCLDTSGQSVAHNGRLLELTSFEYRLLEHLVRHTGKAQSKESLAQLLYGDGEERDSNVIEVFIRRLRKKLDVESTINPITTYRGLGYAWTLESR